MRKIKLLVASAIASAFVFLGGVFTPISAFAEEPENSVETSEIITSEEVVEETESVENTPNDEVVESVEKEPLTFDDILSFVGDIAEKEGFGDEWDKALYHLETAASKKKVDLMVVLSAITVALFVGDRLIKVVKWYIKKKNDTTSKDIKDIKTANGQQTSAINGLIDEAEKVEGVAKDSVRREKALANALAKQNVAIRCLIRGTNIKQDLKDEAFRSLNDSDDLCDEAKK